MTHLVCRSIFSETYIHFSSLIPLSDHPQALSQFEKMYQLDPTRIEDLDIYSNLLHLLESREKLTALAERFLLTDKDRPEVCCIVGTCYNHPTCLA